MAPSEFVGVDGCKAGWFSVGLGEGEPDTKTFPKFSDLLLHYREAKLVLIDIPIGLLEGEATERSCDLEARARLGAPRCFSVFPTPPREVVHRLAVLLRDDGRSPHFTFDQANQLARHLMGKGVSQQTHAITLKIAEVDEVMTARDGDANPKVREVHPEVCFWALNRKQAMACNKKKAAGREERLRALQATEPQTQQIVDEACYKYLRGDVAKDDILDALAAAVTAREGSLRGALRTIPVGPPTDSKGLPMEMVYWGKNEERH